MTIVNQVIKYIINYQICFLNNLAYKYVIISNHGLTNESYLYKGEELNYLPIDLNKIRMENIL
jgi:hypothetical protein